MKPSISLLIFSCLCIITAEGKSSYQSLKSDTKQAAIPFQFSFRPDGSYSLQQAGKVWLESGPTFIRHNGKRYGSDDKSLKLKAVYSEVGSDKIGPWQSNCYRYLAGDSTFVTCAKTWTQGDLPVIIFQQTFVNGTHDSSAGDSDHVISGFPSFLIPSKDEGLAFLSFQGSMFAYSSKTARWNSKETTQISGGDVGGPVLLYDQNGTVVVTAPFAQFVSAARAKHESASLNWGVMGSVDSVPAGFQYETIVYYGYTGINRVFSDWGRLMRFYYGKDDRYRKTDLTLNYLGYWTDRGGYYYYNPESNKTYEQTILDVKTYADSVGLPYRYVQYDSWFYPKDANGGVTQWEPMSSVAPDGFQYIYNITHWPLAAHNRWWSPNTPYAKQNGGQFEFILEKERALPQDQNFWVYLFQQAHPWGLIVYEQDWLDQTFVKMNITQNNVDVTRKWLLQMGEAARESGISIQYCTASPRFGLQSLEIPAVSQGRASEDYLPGKDQWKIGISSIFADAVGIAPFKDNFWTVKDQPGNTYNLHEDYSELHAAVATLSTGPVAPSDRIQYTDVSLLMQCCRSDGLILQPDKPAMAIDKQFWMQAWQGTAGPDGEVWTTYSNIGDFWRFGIILAADMSNNYLLTPADAGFDELNASVVMTRSRSRNTPTVQDFDNLNSPLQISTGCSKKDFCLFYTSPKVEVSGMEIVFYGEEGKFVPLSGGRIANIDLLPGDIEVTLKGSPGESVTFGYFSNRKYKTSSCVIGSSGKSRLSLLTSSCQDL